MGAVDTITHNRFPKQTLYVGRRVTVYFHHDLDHPFSGTIVRDDVDRPLRTIIRLDNGRVVLTDECQFRFGVKGESDA